MKTKQRGWQLAVMLIFWGTSCSERGGEWSGAAARQDDSAKESAPRAENAKFETRDVTGSLAETISEVENSASKPQWIGYAANAVAGERTVCSGNYGDGGGTERGRCALESEQEGWGDANGKKRGAAVGALKLEGNRKLIRYMFHVKQHF